MDIKDLCEKIFDYAEKQGFHEKTFNFGESLMLVVSELSEALEADREGKPFEPNKTTSILWKLPDPEKISSDDYEAHIRGSVAEEIADAIIRLCHLAERTGIDLEWHIKAKMAYNETRPKKHGKKY